MPQFRKLLTASAAIALMAVPVACAQVPTAPTPAAPMQQAMPMTQYNMNSIQPETTLAINAEATISKAPDIAYVSAGVQEEHKTAQEAMAAQADAMNGLMKALNDAGVESRHIQTSGLSLQPRYDYIETKAKDGTRTGERVLRGYIASNMVTAKVSDLENLGQTIDSMVKSGGNTLNGINFALDDDSDVLDEARRKAMADAQARAKLYADAAGLTIKRIVSINESGSYQAAKQQVYATARMEMAMDSAPTPVSGGELDFTSRVSVVYELTGN